MARKKLEDTEFTEGSGNIFADLGMPNPEELLAEAERRWKERHHESESKEIPSR